MKNCVFAIPSYNRAEKQLTLQYLHNLGFKKEDIFLAVQNKKDKNSYETKYSKYANIIYRECKGVAANRNTLLHNIDSKYIVMLDDDIKSIDKLGEDNKLLPITNKKDMINFLKKTFNYCSENNAKLWGIYPIYNSFFRFIYHKLI